MADAPADEVDGVRADIDGSGGCYLVSGAVSNVRNKVQRSTFNIAGKAATMRATDWRRTVMACAAMQWAGSHCMIIGV
jgi:hypothetical protein